MRKYYNLLFALYISFITIANAQQKELKIEDYSNRALYPESIRQLQWVGKTDLFTYTKNNCLIEGKVDSMKTDTILKLSELSSIIEKQGLEKLSGFPDIKWTGENIFWFVSNNKIFTYDFLLKKIEIVNKFSDKAENTDIDRNTYNIAYTIDNNLYVSVKSQEIQVTADNNKGIVNGRSVHRDEFGISKGTFWSPKGSLLAFYRMDETMVTDYPLVNIDTRIAEIKNIKYPMAGMKSHEVTVEIFNPVTKKTVFLKTGEPKEQYLTNITWSPDEKSIFIAVLNREQNHMKLNQYNVSTGDYVKTLFEEKNDKWVEPLNGLSFLNKNTNQFIWQSERDGNNHLYIFNTEGKLIKQLTKGNWEVTDLLGISPDDSEVFYLSNEVSPIDKDVYSVNLNKGKTKKLTQLKGTHSAIINENGKYFFDILSSQTIGREYKIIDTEGKEKQTLLSSLNPMKDYKLGETSIFTIKADDGTDLYCRMIKPVDFNPEKKYPVLVYVYGGPHSQMVSDTWQGGAGMFLNYFAAKGYVVFTLDNRGTGARGQAFEQSIHRHLGDFEVKDQMKGIEYLKSLKFVDGERIAVHGWSYGGFMTISMMLKNKGVFKVGVAGGPVIDWKYYEVMYGERYMDTPDENPEGYENASLLNHVKNLEGKLLIIHGDNDGTVLPQHSLTFIKKCINEGKQVDLFLYPGHEHNIGGKDRLHLFQKIFDYIDSNLK